jgi:hypothetical protein
MNPLSEFSSVRKCFGSPGRKEKNESLAGRERKRGKGELTELKLP